MSALRHFFEYMSSNESADADKPKQPKLTLTEDDLAKIPHTEPPKVATRAEVEQALKKFLEELAKAQKNKNNVVRSTDKVWQADVALHEGLTDDGRGPFTPTGGDGHDYEAADLAGKIAGQLPDTIPIENYKKFLKLTAKDTALPGSTTDQIRKKYEEARDRIVAKLPEKVRGLAKKGMDLAVEKGLPYVADAALKGAGVSSDVEGEMKKAVEDYAKKITGDKSQ